MQNQILQRMIEERRRRGISQAQLAAMCGIPQSTIGRIECGLVIPNLATLEKLSSALGMRLVAQKKEASSDYLKRWDKLHALCFWADEPVSEVYVEGREVRVKRFVTHPVKQIFHRDRMDIVALSEIFRSRCWEEDREGIDKILAKLGLTRYDPLSIVKKTHGVSYNDFLWFQFEGEHLYWRDVAPGSRYV